MVSNPVISVRRWNTVGIGFSRLFNLSSTAGHIRIKYPVLINSLSFYQASSNQIITIPDVNTWGETLYSGTAPNYGLTWNTVSGSNWSAYVTTNFTTTNEIVTTSPSEIYKSFIGTNKILFEANTAYQFKVGDYQYRSYNDTFSTIKILSAT